METTSSQTHPGSRRHEVACRHPGQASVFKLVGATLQTRGLSGTRHRARCFHQLLLRFHQAFLKAWKLEGLGCWNEPLSGSTQREDGRIGTSILSNTFRESGVTVLSYDCSSIRACGTCS